MGNTASKNLIRVCLVSLCIFTFQSKAAEGSSSLQDAAKAYQGISNLYTLATGTPEQKAMKNASKGFNLAFGANGKKKNPKEGRKLLRKAIKDPNLSADWLPTVKCHLGLAYLDSYKESGKKKHATNAGKIIEGAAKKDVKFCQLQNAYVYLDGMLGKKRDIDKAKYWFDQFLVGIDHLIEKGEWSKKDVDQYRQKLAAIEVDIFKRMAADGDPEAQFELGIMYHKGEHVEKDQAMAFSWIEKSANQGNIHAQYNLGQMYRMGVGTQTNLDKAAVWYKKSADQGHTEAYQNYLAVLDDVNPAEATRLRDRDRRAAEEAAAARVAVRQGQLESRESYHLATTFHESLVEKGGGCWDIGMHIKDVGENLNIPDEFAKDQIYKLVTTAQRVGCL